MTTEGAQGGGIKRCKTRRAVNTYQCARVQKSAFSSALWRSSAGMKPEDANALSKTPPAASSEPPHVERNISAGAGRRRRGFPAEVTELAIEKVQLGEAIFTHTGKFPKSVGHTA
ncbi:hypothetical protein PGTUg99_026526 [Puccinia graminis f. sp. tritici]|uniref:Uncharacterized protein n=2 Tax=Puccinia graminis f. sp. tritici TaxID=56615 RepID=E3KC62_PUCGT|nr:uncharacterized protein PGTG_08254 [Puccinia graminis f. sp. tritici CRL 75-36-700-3]EFP82005.1 hypothetical protein PGTG_08254 [Puccinia graminis f. sp. tritici CRL 75-36-700-3]KAA1138050.1 hypothetical protein PGTUg99_026526 [Puccinia graminis f. sp. tritici]